MTIWIDADACPRIIKEIIFKASQRLQLPVQLVANAGLSKHHSALISSVVVSGGFDAADDHIVLHATAKDLVITADIPLAARVVARGGSPLIPGESSTRKKTWENVSPCAT